MPAAKANGKFRIENGIPLPSLPRKAKYPIRDIKVGQSFLVPAELAQPLRMAISQMKKREAEYAKWEFTVRKTDDGYRCWRIA